MVITVDQLREVPITGSGQHIKHVLVDYKKIQVAALTMARSGLFSRSQTIPYGAVTKFDLSGFSVEQSPDQSTPATATEQFADQTRFGDLTEREVFTERKRYLGRLVTYKFDTDSGNITALWVKPPLVLRDLWRQILLISRSQIVQMTPQAVIVDEAIIKSALKPAAAAELARGVEPAFGAASEIAVEPEAE
jgi:sporulation protein YlmC with PRC-barrel domain